MLRLHHEALSFALSSSGTVAEICPLSPNAVGECCLPFKRLSLIEAWGKDIGMTNQSKNCQHVLRQWHNVFLTFNRMAICKTHTIASQPELKTTLTQDEVAITEHYCFSGNVQTDITIWNNCAKCFSSNLLSGMLLSSSLSPSKVWFRILHSSS